MKKFQITIYTEFENVIIPGYFSEKAASAVVTAVNEGGAFYVVHIKDINTGEEYGQDMNDEWVKLD